MCKLDGRHEFESYHWHENLLGSNLLFILDELFDTWVWTKVIRFELTHNLYTKSATDGAGQHSPEFRTYEPTRVKSANSPENFLHV